MIIHNEPLVYYLFTVIKLRDILSSSSLSVHKSTHVDAFEIQELHNFIPQLLQSAGKIFYFIYLKHY